MAEAIFELGQALGQDAGARALDAGLHRQPHRPAVLRRDAGAAARAARRAGDDRRLPARRGLSHGAVRADGPDRPRHQLRRHPVGVRRQLRRQALPAVAGAARDGRRRPARAQVAAAASSPIRRAGSRPPPRRVRRAADAAGRARRPARHRRRRRPLGRAARATPACRFETDRGEPLERPADRDRRAAPHRRPRRGAGRRRRRRARSRAVRPRRWRPAAARPGTALALQRLAASTSADVARRRPPSGCASPAGRRSRSAMRPGWSSRARSRCSSTKPATRCSRACARPRAPTRR